MTLDHSFTRTEILDRLHASIKAGKPIVGAGCSAGIVAKAAELGGADFIVVYSTAARGSWACRRPRSGTPTP